MSEITFVGTGLMGAGLARMTLAAGRRLTVWNRTENKTATLVKEGAHGAATLAEGIAASPVILICIDNYSATRKMLEEAGVLADLEAKILVQVSTGTPGEAREMDEWISGFGVHYMDGAVLAGPETLSGPEGRIILCGPEEAWNEARSVLSTMGTHVRYLGANIRSASALDLAWLCRHYGMFAGVTHGIVICESEGVGLDQYAEVYPDSDYAHHFVRAVHRDRLDETTGTLATWGAAFGQIAKQADDAGIQSGFVDLVSGLFERGIEAGYGDLDIAALAKVLKS